MKELSIPISSTSFATASVRAAELLGCYTRNGLGVKFPLLDTGSTLTGALVSGLAQPAMVAALKRKRRRAPSLSIVRTGCMEIRHIVGP